MSTASSPVMVDTVQQRRFLENEERKSFAIMHSAMVPLADPRPQEDDFLTPSPYSTDSNYSASGDPGYFSPHHHHDLGGLEHQMAGGFPPVSATQQQFITPSSPCHNEPLVGYSCPSPYSSPYNSPQSGINTPLQVPISPPQAQSMDLLSNPHHMVSDASYYADTSLAAMSMSPYVSEAGVITSTAKCDTQYYQSWNPSFTVESFLSAPNMMSAPPNQIMEGGEVPIKVFQQDIHYYGPPTPPETTDNGHAYGQDAMVNPCYTSTVQHNLCQQFPVESKPSCTSRGQPKKRPKAPKVQVQVDDSGIKDIPTSAQLWEFTLRVLKKPMYHYMVNWDSQKDGLFRFHDAQAFAALWGKHRNRPSMTYDKVARALRYYYKRDILNQVGGRLTYKFSKRLGKLYTSEQQSSK